MKKMIISNILALIFLPAFLMAQSNPLDGYIEKYSDKAYKEIPCLVDFVYLDGDHTFDGVYKDLKNYYPLVESGGILAGHDADSPDVAKAVCKFVTKHNLDVRFLSNVGSVEFLIIKK